MLSVANGTIDLRTQKLRDAQPDDLITRATEVAYDPKATAPRWLQFLTEIFAGDTELIRYVQRAVGYSFTGDTREQCFFILFGTGANGKSTFVETLCKLLGTHAETAEFSTFLVRRQQGSPRNDVARLHAARFVKAAEGDHKAVLDEALIKEVTGEDIITARFLYQEYFSFRPRFKIWLITNHKPEIRGTDPAIWRRVKLIPFTRCFDDKNREPDLRSKLEAELSGILNWAIGGCHLWQKNGLGEAPRIVQATQEYRRESDQVGRFLRDRCNLARRLGTAAQKLYESYLGWCSQQGEKPLANNVFARGLGERGISKRRGRSGITYQGVGLVSATTSVVTSLLPKKEQEQ